MLEHRDKHGRDAIDGGAFFVLDGQHRLGGLECLTRKNHGHPMNDSAEGSKHAAETVVKGHWDTQAIER